MTEVTDDDSHPIPPPPIETWTSSLRTFVAMALIGCGGVLTLLWAAFLVWLAGRALYLW